MRSLGGLGLLPQADLAVALAALVAGALPGTEALTLIGAVVGINALVGPVLFRLALVKSGEAGRRSGRVLEAAPVEAELASE